MAFISQAYRRPRLDKLQAFQASMAIAGFGAGAIFGIFLTRDGLTLAPVWPANGILCAALLLIHDRLTRLTALAGSFFVSIAVNAYFGTPAAIAVVFSIMNISTVALARHLISRVCPDKWWQSSGEHLTYFILIGGVLCPGLAAAIGAAAVAFTSHETWLQLFWNWYVSDALGYLLAVPAILILFDKETRAETEASHLTIALLAALFASSMYVVTVASLPLLFLAFPALALVAFRLGPRATIWSALLLSVVLLFETTRGKDFVHVNGIESFTAKIHLIQFFILVALFTALPMANAVAKITRLSRRLSSQEDMRNDAWSKLAEVNAALLKKNDDLAIEIDWRESMEAEVREQKRRLDAAINHMSQGLIMFGADDRVELVNQRIAEIYGISKNAVKVQMSFSNFISMLEENAVFANADDYQRMRELNLAAAAENIFRLASDRWVSIAHAPLAKGGIVTTHEDITEKHRHADKLLHMAMHDGLTGLPNRLLLQDRLSRAFSGEGASTAFALLLLDLDGFKLINDTHGHPVGDAVLQAVAERLRACVRESDTVARLGGDEFAVLLMGTDIPAAALAAATRIRDAVAEPIDVFGLPLETGTSIGIALAPSDAETPADLTRVADIALYRAKRDRIGFAFYDNVVDGNSLATHLATDLRSVDRRRAIYSISEAEPAITGTDD